MDPTKYSILNCASIDVEYLHTNRSLSFFFFLKFINRWQFSYRWGKFDCHNWKILKYIDEWLTADMSETKKCFQSLSPTSYTLRLLSDLSYAALFSTLMFLRCSLCSHIPWWNFNIAEENSHSDQYGRDCWSFGISWKVCRGILRFVDELG